MKAINGDDLLRRVNFLLATIYTPELVEILKALKEYLEKAPTLTLDDLRPKGRRGPNEPEGDVWFHCSECGTEISTSWNYDCDQMWNYCPNCGADMRGGGEG